MEPTHWLDFFHAAGGLKAVARQGWVDRGVPSPESVADHTFRSAIMAWMLGHAAGLDAVRLVKLALVHDLAESEVGDATPYADAIENDADFAQSVRRWRELLTPEQLAAAKQTKRRVEAEAASRLTTLLPAELGAEVQELWTDYAERRTPEARFAAQIDKLEALLQAVEYRDAGHPSDVENFLISAREAVEHPVLRAFLAELETRAGALPVGAEGRSP